MAASYHRLGRNEPAVFELFVRKLPPNRDWLVVCGLGPTLRLIAEMRFGPAELDYLGTLGFSDDFLALPRGIPLRRRHRRDAGGDDRLRQRAPGPGDRAADRGPAARDAAAQPDQLPDDDRHQGGTGGARRRRQGRFGDRLLPQAGPRDRRRDEGRARLRGRGLRRHLERRGRDALRALAGRHDGPLLRAQLRERGGGVRGLHEGQPRERAAPGRHLRHARGRPSRDRGLPPHRDPADRRADRLGRPGRARPRGAAPARRGGVRRGRDRRLGRPRGAQDRRDVPRRVARSTSGEWAPSWAPAGTRRS